MKKNQQPTRMIPRALRGCDPAKVLLSVALLGAVVTLITTDTIASRRRRLTNLGKIVEGKADARSSDRGLHSNSNSTSNSNNKKDPFVQQEKERMTKQALYQLRKSFPNDTQDQLNAKLKKMTRLEFAECAVLANQKNVVKPQRNSSQDRGVHEPKSLKELRQIQSRARREIEPKDRNTLHYSVVREIRNRAAVQNSNKEYLLKVQKEVEERVDAAKKRAKAIQEQREAKLAKQRASSANPKSTTNRKSPRVSKMVADLLAKHNDWKTSPAPKATPQAQTSGESRRPKSQSWSAGLSLDARGKPYFLVESEDLFPTNTNEGYLVFSRQALYAVRKDAYDARVPQNLTLRNKNGDAVPVLRNLNVVRTESITLDGLKQVITGRKNGKLTKYKFQFIDDDGDTLSPENSDHITKMGKFETHFFKLRA